MNQIFFTVFLFGTLTHQLSFLHVKKNARPYSELVNNVHYNLILPKGNHPNKNTYRTYMYYLNPPRVLSPSTTKNRPGGSKISHTWRVGTYIVVKDGQAANHAETPPVIPVQVRALGISVVEKDLSVSPAVDFSMSMSNKQKTPVPNKLQKVVDG